MSWWDQRAPHVSREWLIPIGLLVFFSTLYFPGLGDYGLFDPWETHYGEVARNMVETGNYIDPVWGSPWDSGEVKRERAPFYSKPPLTMWLMAAGMKLFGANAFGVRFFFPILGLLALLSVYLTTARVVSRRAGVFAALLCGLAPSFGFLTHQAVTDGPLVAIMTLGMMCLAMALADSRDGEEASTALKLLVHTVMAGVIFGQLWVISAMDQSFDAIHRSSEGTSVLQSIRQTLTDLWWVARGKGWVLATILLPISIWTLTRTFRFTSRRLAYLTLFYVSCGLMVCAKGWLGWAPVGGALLIYLLTSQEWRWLKVAQIRWGLIIVILTGHIWVLAMLGGHHPSWYQRFIIHDHINRLFAGVHSTDQGAIEYFVQWIGYGLFPMVGLLPAAFGRALSQIVQAERQHADEPAQQTFKRWGKRAVRFELLMFGWMFFGFFIFSKSNTKFHHYIFPIIPPCAILIALWLEEAWSGRAWQRRLMAVVACLTLVWVGIDLVRAPSAPGQGAQNWVNLFTYKYDRAWPTPVDQDTRDRLNHEATQQAWLTHLDFVLTEDSRRAYSPELDQAMKADEWHQTLEGPSFRALLLCFMGLICLALPWLSGVRLGIILILCSATFTSAFTLHTYLPKIAPYWSQWELWDTYYQDCHPFRPDLDADARRSAFERHLLQTVSRVPDQLNQFPRRWCAEPAVAFRMNWRGETFYTGNTVLPVLYGKDLKTFLQQWSGDFYLFTERKRIQSELQPSLPKELKGAYREVFGGDRHFALFKFERNEAEKMNHETKP